VVETDAQTNGNTSLWIDSFCGRPYQGVLGRAHMQLIAPE